MTANGSPSFTTRQAAITAWANECAGWYAMGSAGTQDAFEMELLDGLVLAWWAGEPFGADHYLLIPPDFDGDLDSVLRVLAPRLAHSSSALVIRWLMEAEQPEWRLAADEHDFLQTNSDSLMVARLGSSQAALPPAAGVTLTPASVQEYQAGCQVIHTVFNGPLALTHFFAPPRLTQLYIAYWNGIPASAACLWPFGGAAGVYSVATLPTLRGRGLATGLVNRMLLDASAQGYELACLRCADSLVPLYARNGFRPVGRVFTYYKNQR